MSYITNIYESVFINNYCLYNDQYTIQQTNSAKQLEKDVNININNNTKITILKGHKPLSDKSML